MIVKLVYYYAVTSIWSGKIKNAKHIQSPMVGLISSLLSANAMFCFVPVHKEIMRTSERLEKPRSRDFKNI